MNNVRRERIEGVIKFLRDADMPAHAELVEYVLSEHDKLLARLLKVDDYVANCTTAVALGDTVVIDFEEWYMRHYVRDKL